MTEPWVLEGKTAVVTGATSGLGRLAALEFATRGARLRLVAREPDRAHRVIDEITSRVPGCDVRAHFADLSSQEEVRRVADEIVAIGEPVHVLLNNAGAVFGFRRQVSDDGIEMTFALNHLAYFALTLRLLPRLREASLARVVNVTGDAYKDAGARFDFDDYNAERRYRPIRQYAMSKLANILFTRELATRLADSGIAVNAAGPHRTTATRFAHNVHPLAKLAMRLASPFLLSPEKGVEPIVHLCASERVTGLTGSYWSGMRQPALEAAATDEADARRLWDLSVSLTGLDL